MFIRFTCCFNMAFNLTKSIWALICLHDVIRESVAALTDNFADAFVFEKMFRSSMTLGQCYDIQKFDADAILFREI